MMCRRILSSCRRLLGSGFYGHNVIFFLNKTCTVGQAVRNVKTKLTMANSRNCHMLRILLASSVGQKVRIVTYLQ